jgi:hypothetical protein
MKLVLTLTFVLGAFEAAFTQEPAAPARPPQDPKALAMLEKLDSLVYSPRAAGLKDLEFTVKLPVGFHLLLRWKAPNLLRADLVVPPDAPAQIKKQLELSKANFEAEARKSAPSFAVTQLGEVLRDKHNGDEISLVAPNEVKIVARSEASKAAFKEQTLTFNEQGLVTRARMTAPNGLENVIEPTFIEKDGKHVYQSLKTTIGKQETVAAYEYVNAGTFLMVKKITVTAKGSPPQALEFDGFKANAGIADEVFGK